MPTGSASSSSVRRAAAAGAVLALALAGYGFLLSPGRAPYSPHSDFVSFGLASKTVLYESLRSGRGLPFWRSDEFSGVAAMADPQNAYTCPLNVLFWLLPAARAVGPTLWLYFLAAGLIGWACGAALGVGEWPRLFMAAALMFDFKVLAAGYAGWLPSFPSVIVLPLLFAAFLRALEKPGGSGALGLALAGALCLYSGHFQLLYYSLLFLAGLAAARARGGPLPWRTLAAGALLAAGLAAVVLVPLAAEGSLLSRARPSYDFFLSGHGLLPPHLLTFIHPEVFGTPALGTYAPVELWEDVAYFGIIPLALAVAAVAWDWRRPLTRALTAAFAAAVLLSLRSPLQRLCFAVLPGFSLFRLPGRLLFLAGWFGIALSGLGLEEVLRRRPWRRPWLIALGLVLAVAAEGSFYARRYLATAPQSVLLPSPGTATFFSSQGSRFRVAPVERGALNYGWAAPLGLELATGYSSFNYSRYQAYFDLLRWNRVHTQGARVWTDLSAVARPDLLDALNVRFLVSRRPIPTPRASFALAARLPSQAAFDLYRGTSTADLFIYENRRALQRAFLVAATVPARGWEEAALRVWTTGLRDAAVVEGAEEAPAAGGASSGDGVKILESSPGRLKLLVRVGRPRYLVISEVWDPGWRARLDGVDLLLHPTDLTLMGAWIPPGEHRLVLDYVPSGWRLGLLLSVASAAACLVLAVSPGLLGRP